MNILECTSIISLSKVSTFIRISACFSVWRLFWQDTYLQEKRSLRESLNGTQTQTKEIV